MRYTVEYVFLAGIPHTQVNRLHMRDHANKEEPFFTPLVVEGILQGEELEQLILSDYDYLSKTYPQYLQRLKRTKNGNPS